MSDSAWIVTTVIYCTMRRQFWTEVAVPAAATVRDAIVRSKLLPKIDRQTLACLEVCVAGVPTELGVPVSAAPTIEVYSKQKAKQESKRRRRRNRRG